MGTILATKMPLIDKMIECTVADYAKDNISEDAVRSEIQGWVLARAPQGHIWDFHVSKWVEENAPDAEEKFDEKIQKWIENNAPNADEKFSEAVDGWVDSHSPSDAVFDEKAQAWVNDNAPNVEVSFDSAIENRITEELEHYSVLSDFISKLAYAIHAASQDAAP
jgi:hypothetical protein